MSQMKGQDKTHEKQLNEVEIGNLPEKSGVALLLPMVQLLSQEDGNRGKVDHIPAEVE